jgi:DsbC/DsbD-like thiol-disulfide interchange protein
MTLRSFFTLALASVLSGVGTADDSAGRAKKSDAVVKVTAKAERPAADGTQVVNVKLAITKPWHLYANAVGNDDLASGKTEVTVSGADKPQAVKTEYPKGKAVKDAVVGDYYVYEGDVTVKVTIKRPAGATGKLEASVKLQACSDKTCLLPSTVKAAVEGP